AGDAEVVGPTFERQMAIDRVAVETIGLPGHHDEGDATEAFGLAVDTFNQIARDEIGGEEVAADEEEIDAGFERGGHRFFERFFERFPDDITGAPETRKLSAEMQVRREQ